MGRCDKEPESDERQNDRGTHHDEALTMQIQVTLGTRGHFDIVLPVMCRAASGVVARYQGVPKAPDLRR